jgi:PKD repeat protein
MKNLKFVLGALVLAIVAAGSVYAAGLSSSIVSPTAGSTFTVGQSVSLQAASTGAVGAVNYVWSFSDGTASITGQNQSMVFSTAGTKTITLMSGDASGANSTQSVNVTVASSTSAALAISNVQVTNVTSSGATITWDTNLPATSRVIYDTASHAGTIDPAVGGPNFGYANSTSADATLVTSHSVTVSGLSASTQYFFRAISTN